MTIIPASGVRPVLLASSILFLACFYGRCDADQSLPDLNADKLLNISALNDTEADPLHNALKDYWTEQYRNRILQHIRGKPADHSTASSRPLRRLRIKTKSGQQTASLSSSSSSGEILIEIIEQTVAAARTRRRV